MDAFPQPLMYFISVFKNLLGVNPLFADVKLAITFLIHHQPPSGTLSLTSVLRNKKGFGLYDDYPDEASNQALQIHSHNNMP